LVRPIDALVSKDVARFHTGASIYTRTVSRHHLNSITWAPVLVICGSPIEADLNGCLPFKTANVPASVTPHWHDLAADGTVWTLLCGMGKLRHITALRIACYLA
jgi:hypothetical protein